MTALPSWQQSAVVTFTCNASTVKAKITNAGGGAGVNVQIALQGLTFTHARA
jgi:hypothetical protein